MSSDKGARVFRVAEQNGKLDLDEVLKTLAGEGITRLMVEGGPTRRGELRQRPIWSTRRCCCRRVADEGDRPLEGMLTRSTEACRCAADAWRMIALNLAGLSRQRSGIAGPMPTSR